MLNLKGNNPKQPLPRDSPSPAQFLSPKGQAEEDYSLSRKPLPPLLVPLGVQPEGDGKLQRWFISHTATVPFPPANKAPFSTLTYSHHAQHRLLG